MVWMTAVRHSADYEDAQTGPTRNTSLGQKHHRRGRCGDGVGRWWVHFQLRENCCCSSFLFKFVQTAYIAYVYSESVIAVCELSSQASTEQRELTLPPAMIIFARCKFWPEQPKKRTACRWRHGGDAVITSLWNSRESLTDALIEGVRSTVQMSSIYSTNVLFIGSADRVDEQKLTWDSSKKQHIQPLSFCEISILSFDFIILNMKLMVAHM